MSTRYTLVVGTKDWSSWSLRAYVALRATGVAFEEVLVPLRQQPLTGNEITKFSKADACRFSRSRTMVAA